MLYTLALFCHKTELESYISLDPDNSCFNPFVLVQALPTLDAAWDFMISERAVTVIDMQTVHVYQISLAGTRSRKKIMSLCKSHCPHVHQFIEDLRIAPISRKLAYLQKTKSKLYQINCVN